MKVDKSNPKHWLILLISGILLVLALPLRLNKGKKNKKTIVLYGHKLNGNLLPFYEYSQDNNESNFRFYYLTLDPDYRSALRGCPNILKGTKFKDLIKIVKADAFITDHGLHHFALLKKVTDIKFIDVWHGIPYKGFDKHSFSALHDYDEVWVSSPKMKEMYENKFGFKPEKVKVTGYARVERLLNYPYSRKEILQKYGLKDRKTVLIAPTWQQDDSGRSIVPFGLTLKEFIAPVVEAAPDAQIIFRAHLNVGDTHQIKDFDNVYVMPYGKYPVSEDFLAISDVLISDWSSIAFDYLPLNKPVIYLDVPAPFKLGFSLGPEYRFGVVAKNVVELEEAATVAIKSPELHIAEYSERRAKTLTVAYGSALNKKVVENSIKRLTVILKD